MIKSKIGQRILCTRIQNTYHYEKDSIIYMRLNKCHFIVCNNFNNPFASMNATTQPTTLGEYKLSKIIGQGTFGKVQLGIHIPTGQKVAIKILQKQKIIDQADIERVTRQICILKILRHPNVVQLYEIIETKQNIHLVMEYAEGGELFDHIVNKRRLPQRQAVKYMQQLLAGVQYLHKNGIVHRDLKPQNLLLDAKGLIKIVDFGLSNQYNPGQKLKTACGSPCYAAPEMIAGKSYECSGVDIWSCGIVLFAMLCGYLPFQDENTNRLYKKILAGDLHLPKHLSEGSKQILQGILNVNPQARFTIAKIRQTTWYNQAKSNYHASGIIIGRDAIEINEAVISKMQVFGYETTNLRPFLANNKHNYLTAFYYLLKVKLERSGSIVADQGKKVNASKQKDIVRTYSPPKNHYHVPHTEPADSSQKRRRRDDSLNAAKIISSIVSANKKKINTHHPQSNSQAPPNRIYQFKKFPVLGNFQSSHVYQRQAQHDSPRQRSEGRSASLSNKFAKTAHLSTKFSPPKTQSSLSHSTRQEMVNQLRQFPAQIHNEMNVRTEKTGRQPFSPSSFPQSQVIYRHANTEMRNKTEMPPQQKRLSFNHNLLQASQVYHQRKRVNTNTKKIHPFIHIGPFNANCLFMESPGNLLLKIILFLRKMNIFCRESDHFTLSLDNDEEISVESFMGVQGYFLVKFSSNTPLSQQIIEHLKP